MEHGCATVLRNITGGVTCKAMFAWMLLCVGVALVSAGHYRRRLDALEANPVTRVRIVPRTLYDEQMGVDWRTESSGVVAAP